MRKLSEKSFEEIRKWVYQNARLFELTRWKYEFEHGSKEEVLSALSLYQNEDGGFGNALEPDNWNPNSSPYTTLYAIDILKDINATDSSHPIMKGIIKYLDGGDHYDENGWLFSIPSNNEYPHAPWWTYDREANQYESIGVSAGIASFIIEFIDPNTQLYKKALSVIDRLILKLNSTDNYGDMGAKGYITLKNTLHKLGLAGKYDMEVVSDSIRKIVYDSIERDVSKWAYYGKRPSDYIFSPDSEFYKENEDIMQKELDYTIDTRPENGVWGITWSWFDLNDTYPKEFAISENWWKSDVAIRKLKLLRNFDRLDFNSK